MPGPVQSIERAAAILKLLAGGQGRLGLMEISHSLGLAKGTVHGILRTLADVGFVEQDRATGKYQLGAALLHLGSSYLDANELRSRAINWADSLASRSGEAVRIGTLLQGNVLVVHHVFRPDDTLQTIDVGTVLPPHACALGKALLAFDPGAVAALLVAGLPTYTRRTVVSRSGLNASLSEVREQDWAGELDEMVDGESGVAAPIRDRGGLVVGAIGISGSTDRFCEGKSAPRPALVTFVRDAARAISRELGARRW